MLLFITILCLVANAAGECTGPSCGPQGLMYWISLPNPKPLVDWTALVRSGSDLYKKEVVSSECFSAIDQCARDTLTHGKCKSTFGSYLRSFTLADVNVDCNWGPSPQDNLAIYGKCKSSNPYIPCDVGEQFIAVSKNTDANKDGKLCGDEYSASQIAGGLTKEFADWEWEWGTLGLRDATTGCLSLDESHKASPQVALEYFSDAQIERLVGFCQTPEAKTNRDCLGLPSVCRDLRPTFAACRNFTKDDMRTRSLKDKLDMQEKVTDPNQDGISTQDEVTAAILDDYDRNQDGCADEDDWVARWVDYYGFSPEFGRASFAAINADGDNCCNRDDVARVIGNGTDSSYFPNTLLFVIIGMCEATPELYETNTDCAQAVDVCLKYFPENPGCAAFVEKCGANKYRSCVKLLPFEGLCRNTVEREELNKEGLRIDNQVSGKCINQQEACKTSREGRAHLMRILDMN